MNLSRNFVIQASVLLVIVLVFGYFYINIQAHLHSDNIASGFAFLNKASGFDVIMELIPFNTTSSNLRAYYVGILNTLLLATLATIFSTLFGIIIAMLRLSRNWLVAKVGNCYVEFFRNIPLLLQIFFWYFLLLHYMPQTKDSYRLGGLVANVQGISFAGITMIPELIAMLLGLTLYATSHISQHILNGIATVDKGQIEAAIVARLHRFARFRLIIFPQAIRSMLPPIMQQHLTTLKSTALGSAIGYPDLVAIFAGTVLTQTGQALETIFMTMSFYLLLSMLTACLIDLYQTKSKIPGK